MFTIIPKIVKLDLQEELPENHFKNKKWYKYDKFRLDNFVQDYLKNDDIEVKVYSGSFATSTLWFRKYHYYGEHVFQSSIKFSVDIKDKKPIMFYKHFEELSPKLIQENMEDYLNRFVSNKTCLPYSFNSNEGCVFTKNFTVQIDNVIYQEDLEPIKAYVLHFFKQCDKEIEINIELYNYLVKESKFKEQMLELQDKMHELKKAKANLVKRTEKSLMKISNIKEDFYD